LKIIHIKNIGHLANRLLNGRLTCNIWGNTSRGIFLKFHPEGLIFLSYEDFRGPFTLNVSSTVASQVQDLTPGTQIIFGQDRILFFEHQNLGISLGDTIPWQPEAFQSVEGVKDLAGNLTILAGWLESNTPAESFGAVSSLIASTGDSGRFDPASLEGKLRDIYLAIRTSDYMAFVKAAIKVIGLGSGLTPSGDDFLTGMSLCVSRYQHVIKGLKGYSSWFELLSPMMKEKTTVLSSDLYSASLLGSADERLIKAFDSIMKNRMVEEEIIPSIAGWGSSSGFDALSGFYLLMKAIYL
jgi:hypothetical protein